MPKKVENTLDVPGGDAVLFSNFSSTTYSYWKEKSPDVARKMQELVVFYQGHMELQETDPLMPEVIHLAANIITRDILLQQAAAENFLIEVYDGKTGNFVRKDTHPSYTKYLEVSNLVLRQMKDLGIMLKPDGKAPGKNKAFLMDPRNHYLKLKGVID